VRQHSCLPWFGFVPQQLEVLQRGRVLDWRQGPGVSRGRRLILVCFVHATFFRGGLGRLDADDHVLFLKVVGAWILLYHSIGLLEDGQVRLDRLEQLVQVVALFLARIQNLQGSERLLILVRTVAGPGVELWPLKVGSDCGMLYL
jgi:hypothetical protein